MIVTLPGADSESPIGTTPVTLGIAFVALVSTYWKIDFGLGMLASPPLRRTSTSAGPAPS